MKKENSMNISGVYEEFSNEFYNLFQPEWKHFRSCNADVCFTDTFIALRSYSTVVAFFDVRTRYCFDILRAVYGYTATSAQHIRKFAEHYGAVRTIRIDSTEQLEPISQDE